jgi:hypothetical protein
MEEGWRGGMDHCTIPLSLVSMGGCKRGGVARGQGEAGVPAGDLPDKGERLSGL